MKNQKRKNNTATVLDEQIPGQMHIEDFPEYLPNNYFIGGATVKTEEEEMSDFEIKKDCFAYGKTNNNYKALNSLYCKKENCGFYKTKEQFKEGRKK